MRAALAAVAFVASTALACDGGGGGGGNAQASTNSGRSSAPPACDAATEVFPLVCGTSICHDGAINGLDLLSTGVEQRVLDVAAAGTACRGSDLKLVDSIDPTRSLLLLKLSESPPCGAAMPLGSGPAGLTPAQRACIEGFVQALAE